MRIDVAIIGGGAAGLFCALWAGRRGRQVLVLEHSRRLGTKILLAGGGKCNFTNRQCGAENFISENPHFCKSALAGFDHHDFLAFVEELGITYEEREHGRLFCKHSAARLRDALREQCRAVGVRFELDRTVDNVSKDSGFELAGKWGTLNVDSLVIATGGLSYPQSDASDFGYKLAGQFGLKVTKCRPGLVPLLYCRDDKFALSELSGNALEGALEFDKQWFRENILFTHNGLSGPAILQISNYWQGKGEILIDWLPGLDVLNFLWEQKAGKGSSSIKNILTGKLSVRMLKIWSERYFSDKPLAECSTGELQEAAESINQWRLCQRQGGL